MKLSRDIFLVINQLQASFQALESSLQFIKKYGDDGQKESVSRRLASTRPLKGMALDWAERFWKEGASDPLVQDLKRHSQRLLENLHQELAAEADQLEGMLHFSSLPGRGAVVELLAALSRQAHKDELLLRGCVTLSRHGDAGPLASATQGHDDPEPRLLALRHFETLLDSPLSWDEWDLMSLRARILTLPDLLRHDALEAELLADTLVSGAPELTEEARASWAESGFSPEEGASWLGARFLPEEAAEWKKAGISMAAQALDWNAMSASPQEAGAWWSLGFLPEESRCYLAAGIESAAEAAKVRKAFGNFENLRPWIRAQFSVPEALHWKEKGARNADQASALRERIQQGPAQLEPASAPEQPAPEAAKPPEAAAPAPDSVLFFWGRVCGDEAQGAQLEALPSGGFFLAAQGSLQRSHLPENVREPEMLLEWRDELKSKAGSLGLNPDAAAGFHLASVRSGHLPGIKASLFWGADFGPETGPPWKEYMDYLASESWPARLKRKSEEWGETPELELAMGRDPAGGWLAALKPSLHQAEGGECLPIASLDAPKKWRDAFEDFSRIMDLPLKKPRWMQGLADFSEPGN